MKTMVTEFRGELGALENVRRLNTYLAALRAEKRSLPARADAPNLTAIAKACGFDRGVFYQNEMAKILLDEAWRELGADNEQTKPATAFEAVQLKNEVKKKADVRTKGLEDELIRLRAENAALRAENLRLIAIRRMVVEAGRIP